MKYTDPDGDLFWLIPLAFAGTMNVVANWDHIDNFWHGLGYFGTGVVQGALSLTGPGGVIAGGAIAGFANSILTQSVSGNGLIDWGNAFKSSVMGAVSTLAGMGCGELAGKYLGGIVLNQAHIQTQSAIGQMITQGIGGAAGNYAGGFINTFMETGDLKKAHEAGLRGAPSGFALGAASGFVQGYKSALDNDCEPFFGKPNHSVTIGGPMPLVNETTNALMSQNINKNDLMTWPKDLKPYIGQDIPNPEALKFNTEYTLTVVKAKYYIYDGGREGFSPFYHGCEINMIPTNYPRYYRVKVINYDIYRIHILLKRK